VILYIVIAFDDRCWPASFQIYMEVLLISLRTSSIWWTKKKQWYEIFLFYF